MREKYYSFAEKYCGISAAEEGHYQKEILCMRVGDCDAGGEDVCGRENRLMVRFTFTMRWNP